MRTAPERPLTPIASISRHAKVDPVNATVASEARIGVPKTCWRLLAAKLGSLFPHHGVVEMPTRTDIANQRFAGIEADLLGEAMAHQGVRSPVDFFKSHAATQRRQDCLGGVIGIVEGRAKYRHDCIPDIFVDKAAMLLDDFTHYR